MTQTRKEALIELRDKVKAGTADDFGAIKPGWPIFRGYAESAYHGSLDAAKALHEAVLHERVVAEIKHCARYEPVVRIWDMAKMLCETTAINPARAWLLAILEALITKAGDEA